MTDDIQQQARRDPLVEHVVPLIAKAMSNAQDTEELWSYLHARVAAECRRLEEEAVREALEPLLARFSVDAVARVAVTLAEEARAGQAQVA
jgi:hypothetical protein